MIIFSNLILWEQMDLGTNIPNRTKVGCKSCEKNFTLTESLMYHIIEVHGKQ